MGRRARTLLAFGPRLAALMVLIASLLVSPLSFAAEPEPCCCPSPKVCKCPDHAGGDSHGPASIQRCSQPVDPSAPVMAPVAALPAALVLVSPAVPAIAVVTPLPSPHPSPDLDRPRGPS